MTINPSVVLSVEEEKKILARIRDPQFPAREINVRDCGAVGDGTKLDTDALQRAIPNCTRWAVVAWWCPLGATLRARWSY